MGSLVVESIWSQELIYNLQAYIDFEALLLTAKNWFRSFLWLQIPRSAVEAENY